MFICFPIINGFTSGSGHFKVVHEWPFGLQHSEKKDTRVAVVVLRQNPNIMRT